MIDENLSNRASIRKNALRLKEDCLNSSKNNFVYAASLNKWRYVLGVMSTVAAGSIVLSVSANIGPTAIIIPLCSVVALVSSAIVTSWNPGKNSEMHQRIGNEYIALQKKTQQFIDIDVPDETLDEGDLKKTLNTLNEEQKILYKAYSHVVLPEWVHRKVKRKLVLGEALYEFEIDTQPPKSEHEGKR